MSCNKKILLITTGGTIACEDSDVGRTPVETAEGLLEKIGGAPDGCEVLAVSLFSLDSTNMTPAHWIKTAECIKENYCSYDGFVITHGTDTLAYAAAALSCLIENSAKPVALTGSMLPIDNPNTDAKRNLNDTLVFASEGSFHNVAVVFNGKVIDGKCASKCDSKGIDAFESINYPVLATVFGGRVVHTADIKKPCGEPVFYNKMDTAVCVVKLIPGAEPPPVRESVRAVVVEAFGTGGLPETEEYNVWLSELTARKIYVIITTQAVRGGSDLSLYEVGLRIKDNEYVIDAGKMTTEFACMKAMWALANTDNFKRYFLK